MIFSNFVDPKLKIKKTIYGLNKRLYAAYIRITTENIVKPIFKQLTSLIQIRFVALGLKCIAVSTKTEMNEIENCFTSLGCKKNFVITIEMTGNFAEKQTCSLNI